MAFPYIPRKYDYQPRQNNITNDMLISPVIALFRSAMDARFMSLPNNQLSTWAKSSSFALAIFTFLIGNVGIFGNTISILIFRQKEMSSSISVLLIGLCCIDILLSVLSYATFTIQGISVVWSTSAIEQYIVYSPVTIYPITMMVHSISTWLMVVVTIERFIVVSYPLHSRNLCTKKRAKLAILITSFAGVLYNLVRFWEYGVGCASSGPNCTLVPIARFRNNEWYFTFYVTGLYLFAHFLVPFMALSILNFIIVHQVRYAQANRMLMSNQTQSDHRTAIMMTVIVVIFLVCNTTPFVLNILEALNRDLFHNPKTYETAYLILDISNVLVVLNSSINFIIYYKLSRRYREVFWEIICCRRKGFVKRLSVWSGVLTAALIPAASSPIELSDTLPYDRVQRLSSQTVVSSLSGPPTDSIGGTDGSEPCPATQSERLIRSTTV